MHSPTLAKKQRPSTTRSAISFQKSRIPPFPIFLSRLDSSYNHWRSRQDGWIIPLKRTLSLPDFRVAFLVEHFLQGWLGSTLSLSQVIAFSSSRASFHLWRYNQSVSRSNSFCTRHLLFPHFSFVFYFFPFCGRSMLRVKIDIRVSSIPML